VKSGHNVERLPQSEAASAEVLALPIHPELSDAHLQAVVDAMARFGTEPQHS
jgi:dTDP-4-amino-4,6-dideoxygalactose transaminase